MGRICITKGFGDPFFCDRYESGFGIFVRTAITKLLLDGVRAFFFLPLYFLTFKCSKTIVLSCVQSLGSSNYKERAGC